MESPTESAPLKRGPGRPRKTPRPEDEAANATGLEQQLKAATRLLRVKRARENLLDFTVMSMPHPEDPDDAERSRYQAARHHKALAAALEEVEKGKWLRLIITMPPRHGKSEMASRRFPAWFVGRDPYRQIIFATYNDTFALDFGGEVREIIQSDFYSQVFPGCRLRRGSTAKDRLQTVEGGQLSFIGTGGSATGRGADCVKEGTLVETSRGSVPIETVDIGDRVLSLREETGELEYRRVEAVAHRQADGLYRITTASGRTLEVTGNHRIRVGGEFVRASDVSPGDTLLQCVREGVRAPGVRRVQEPRQGALRSLLREGVLGSASRREEREAMREVLCAGGGERSVPGRAVLCGVPPEACWAQTGSPADLRLLPNLRVAIQGCMARWRKVRGLLREAVLRDRPLQEDVCYGEPEVEAWRDTGARAASRGEGVPSDAQGRLGAGWARLRGLLGGGQAPRSASHRQLADEQLVGEPRHPVRAVPSQGAFADGFQSEFDRVVMVERVREEARVHDLQVEGNQNFFAGGLCVHNCLLIDDPIKDREEAESKLVRDKLWSWFLDVALTRLMPGGRVIIIMTRWHEDDLVGRLIDPTNEHFNAEEAAKWKVLDLPALAVENDPIGREPGEALWPERYDAEYLLGIKGINPRGFSALYQGRPAPDDGDFFRKDMIRGYRREDLPRELRYYCGSDHAVSEAQRADKTCLLPVGVDAEGTVWVLPDVWWERKGSEAVAEAMIELMKRRRFLVWWAENGHISKAIGPFLRRMMREQNVNCYIDEVTPVKDKETRAQSIRAMMSLGRVRFPTFAPWWQDAEAELLKFPAARHDDFVDALAHIGRGLDRQTRPTTPAPVVSKHPKTGTFAWVKESSRRERMRQEAERMGGF